MYSEPTAKSEYQHFWDIPKSGTPDDRGPLDERQLESCGRLSSTIQLEQQSYLVMHPEIDAMLKIYFSKMIHQAKRTDSDILVNTAHFFSAPAKQMDKQIRDFMNLPPHVPYNDNKMEFEYDDKLLEHDLLIIKDRHFPEKLRGFHSFDSSLSATESSSFVSVLTSESTMKTPERIPTPEPTMADLFFSTISTTVDKAIYSRYSDQDIMYDTFYVELMKAVEAAMEVPVVDIREDIRTLLANAYRMFEYHLDKLSTIAAEYAWEHRMRKKLKRSLRRQDNFKGYVTPPTPKSTVSSHESYKVPPPRPCECHPPFTYNRYPKDRFGIYLPQETQYSDKNITQTPAVSTGDGDDYEDTEMASESGPSARTTPRKSCVSEKSVTPTPTSTKPDEAEASDERDAEKVDDTGKGIRRKSTTFDL